MNRQQWSKNAGWGFLGIVGVILIVVGFRGRPGSLLAVITCPDEMLTPDNTGPENVGYAAGVDALAAVQQQQPGR